MLAGVLCPILAMLRSSQDAAQGAAIAAMKTVAHGICCELDEAGVLKRVLFQQGYGPECQQSVGLPQLSGADINTIQAALAAAFPDLIALVASHDVDVQEAAAEALLALTWHNERITSQAVLRDAVKALAAQLESKHSNVQPAAANALVPFACRLRGETTSASVVSALVVQLSLANKQVQKAAANTIGELIIADSMYGQEFVAAGVLPALKVHVQPSRFSEANSSKVQYAAVRVLDCLTKAYCIRDILAAGMVPAMLLLLTAAPPEVQAMVLLTFVHSLNKTVRGYFQEAIDEAGAFSNSMKPCLKSM